MNGKKAPKQRYVYRYAGPVTRFGRVISDWWMAATTASSDAEAKRNFCAQFRKEAGLEMNASVTLERPPFIIGVPAAPKVPKPEPAEQLRLV